MHCIFVCSDDFFESHLGCWFPPTACMALHSSSQTRNGPEPTATAVFVVEAKVSWAESCYHHIGASKVNKGRDYTGSASGSGRPMVCRGGNSDGEEAGMTAKSGQSQTEEGSMTHRWSVELCRRSTRCYMTGETMLKGTLRFTQHARRRRTDGVGRAFDRYFSVRAMAAKLSADPSLRGRLKKGLTVQGILSEKQLHRRRRRQKQQQFSVGALYCSPGRTSTTPQQLNTTLLLFRQPREKTGSKEAGMNAAALCHSPSIESLTHCFASIVCGLHLVPTIQC